MKKILFALAAVLMVLSSCSYKRTFGILNNEIMLRDWYGNAAFELSLQGNFNTNFYDSSYGNPPFYLREYDSAAYYLDLSPSIGMYGALYRNDFLKISIGARFQERLFLRFSEFGNHEFLEGIDSYEHVVMISAEFGRSPSVSIVFPDIEIDAPFIDGLKFIIRADLLRLNIFFDGAEFNYRFREYNNTRRGLYRSEAYGSFLPSTVLEGLSLSSTYVDLGNLKLGLVYYFK